jgi:hypothetical protein
MKHEIRPGVTPPEIGADAPAPAEGRGGISARRRFLIRGLVGGPAALIASRPMVTLAMTRSCTYSVALSGNMSTADPIETCTGNDPSFYRSIWTNSSADGKTKFSTAFGINPSADGGTKFSDAFGINPTEIPTGNPMFYDVVHNADCYDYLSHSGSAYWVAAWLQVSSTNLPYSQAQLNDFYQTPKNIDPTAVPEPTRGSIAKFFHDILRGIV